MLTFISLLVCSEPITEEGDGETEPLPSEDGQYGLQWTHKYAMNQTTFTLGNLFWIRIHRYIHRSLGFWMTLNFQVDKNTLCVCIHVQSWKQWRCLTMWRGLQRSCLLRWETSSSFTARPLVTGGEARWEELKVSSLTSTSACWKGK